MYNYYVSTMCPSYFKIKMCQYQTIHIPSIFIPDISIWMESDSGFKSDAPAVEKKMGIFVTIRKINVEKGREMDIKC